MAQAIKAMVAFGLPALSLAWKHKKPPCHPYPRDGSLRKPLRKDLDGCPRELALDPRRGGDRERFRALALGPAPA